MKGFWKLPIVFLFFQLWLQEAASVKVLVLGAGMSGISAAKFLVEKGVEVQILEGQDYIGGRLKQVDFAGYKVEMGANWIQGLEGNPIWDLKNLYNLKGNLTNWDDFVVRDEVNGLEDDANIPWDQLGEVLEFLDEFSVERKAMGEDDTSLRTALRLGGWKGPYTRQQNLIEYYDFDFEFAESPSVTSLFNTKPSSTYTDFEDADFFVTDPRGYSHLARSLAAEFLSPNDTRLIFNQVVKTIKYSPRGCNVTTAANISYTADYCVVTFSIGVLENDVVKFVPELPQKKTEEIFKFSMAIYTKIFLKWDEPFWTEGEFFGFSSSRRGLFPIWQNLNFEKYYPGSNILLVTVTGEESRRIELQSDEQTKDEIMSILRLIFDNSSIPDPTHILVPRWGLDPFFFGSYSNWPIDVEENDFQALRAPVERLFFSGEHTHPKYNGYVHGAYLSGIDTAQDILLDIEGKLSTPAPKPCKVVCSGADILSPFFGFVVAMGLVLSKLL